jgi:hypothetical protein
MLLLWLLLLLLMVVVVVVPHMQHQAWPATPCTPLPPFQHHIRWQGQEDLMLLLQQKPSVVVVVVGMASTAAYRFQVQGHQWLLFTHLMLLLPLLLLVVLWQGFGVVVVDVLL